MLQRPDDVYIPSRTIHWSDDDIFSVINIF